MYNPRRSRTNFVVIPRIPVFLATVQSLFFSLVKASDQSMRLDPTHLKRLVGYSHSLDRLMDQMKKHKEDFARVAPYLIADMVDYFQRIPVVPR
jgi:hypothetical protein